MYIADVYRRLIAAFAVFCPSGTGKIIGIGDSSAGQLGNGAAFALSSLRQWNKETLPLPRG